MTAQIPSKEIIGRIIKLSRKKKKMTLQELGHLLEVDRQYVWRLEQGKVNLTMDYLDKLILHLDCKQSDFIAMPKE